MIERLLNFINEYGIYKPGDRVCCGVSGGADSVCLLLLLNELREKLGIELSAFHVNHNIRGDESDGDQLFVSELCSKYGAELRIFSFDVIGYAKEKGLSTEEAGRILRRKAAGECIADGASKIAFAHHKNDLAETVIFNMVRGSSIKGISGIRPVNGIYTHPLLFAGRREIELYLESRGQSWRTDRTNADNEYTRNRIRNEIIPYMEKNINKAAVRHIADIALDMAMADGIIDELADEAYEDTVSEKDGCFILNNKLKDMNRLISGRVILRVLKKLRGSVRDIDRLHITSVSALFDKRPGSRLDLPGNITAVNAYGDIRVAVKKEQKAEEAILPLAENMDTDFCGWHISSRLVEKPENSEQIPKKEYTKWLDYDIIKRTVFRFRRKGDRMVTGPSGSGKKLKDIFIDKKLTADERDNTLLLADENTVYWALGVRLGENAKVTPETKNVIRIDIVRRA